MYLEAELYVSDRDEKDKSLTNAIKQNAPGGLGSFRPKNVTFELAYWHEYYNEDLVRTVELLDKILSNPDSENWWITYRSCW